MSFEIINNAGISFLVFKPWWEEGIVHGFAGKNLKITRDFGLTKPDILIREFDIESLFVPKQIHSSKITLIELDRTTPVLVECDGLVVNFNQYKNRKMAIGIYTADCLPIFIRRESYFGIIHAGWRGLAAGIIGNCIKLIKERTKVGKWQVVIGPAAGPGRYEVGEDVIKAIGPDGVAEQLSTGKYLLSLAGTASNEAERLLGGEVGVFDCEICTISDHDYNSYRRDGDGAGRNLAFLKC